MTPFGADFELRRLRLQERVACLTAALESCVPYGGLQHAPALVSALAQRVFHEARALTEDQLNDVDEIVGQTLQAQPSLLDAWTILAIVKSAIAELDDDARIGFRT